MLAFGQEVNTHFQSVTSADVELSRLTHIEKTVKNTTIIVIYKVLVYMQMSQPTTCFGLFYLGHLQVGYLGQRKYTVMQYNH